MKADTNSELLGDSSADVPASGNCDATPNNDLDEEASLLHNESFLRENLVEGIPDLRREPYRPGKTARRTERRNAAKIAALVAAEAAQVEEDGLAKEDAPPLRIERTEEETLTFLEENEQESAFDVAFNPSCRVESAATAFVKRGKSRKISQRQQNLLRSYLKHGGIKLQKPVDLKVKKAEEVDIDGLPSLNCKDDDSESEVDVDDDEGEEVDMAELAQQKVVDDFDLDLDFDGNSDDDDEDSGVRQVDFYAVTASWLSDFILGPESKFVDMTDICEAPRVCEAFLNYLLIRNVVPEFEQEIRGKCLPLVKQAHVELKLCKELSFILPGKYNMACSVRFGGEYSALMELSEDDNSNAEEELANGNGTFDDDKVVTVDGVSIQVPRMNATSDPIEGWGHLPDVPKAVQRQWKEEANTEAVMGITRRQVYRFTASIFLKNMHQSPKATEGTNPPTPSNATHQIVPARFSTYARVVEIISVPETTTAETLEACAIAAFYSVKLKFVEDAEEDVDRSDGQVAVIWFDPEAVVKLRVGMLVDAIFHKLPTGDWFVDQVACVLPSYTQDAFY